MTAADETRKFAAIFTATVAGYSRLMQANEFCKSHHWIVSHPALRPDMSWPSRDPESVSNN